MIKEDFRLILQSSLLAFDGVQVEEIISHYGIPKKFARIGFELTEYLQSIEEENLK
jgi:hypothetical protein